MYTRFCAVLARLCLKIGVGGLVLLIAAVLYQVIGRYVLNDTPTWAESGAVLLVLYVTMLGMAGTPLAEELKVETANFGERLVLRRLARQSAPADGLVAFVEVQNGPKPETLVTLPLPAGTKSVELRLTGDGLTLAFDYALAPGAWQPLLPKSDSYTISVQAAGGGLHFTGALGGPYVRIEP